METDEWNPNETSFLTHVIAGALAGTAEHVGMFPVDTVKTHLQAELVGPEVGAIRTARIIFDQRGLSGLFRGVSAVFTGAAPAHAIQFSTYEAARKALGASRDGHHPVATAASGALATIIADAVMTPADATKQKMQLNIHPYKNAFDCARLTVRNEGFSALYAGYTTQLTMNVPYSLLYFTTYESLRHILSEDSEAYDPLAYSVSGGLAGVVASACTNPLDVAKTRLQTMGEVGRHYTGMTDALESIWREQGSKGLFRGVGPRMLFHSTSAAICWSVYELLKSSLLAAGWR